LIILLLAAPAWTQDRSSPAPAPSVPPADTGPVAGPAPSLKPLFGQPLFTESPGVWLAVSGAGMLGGLGLTIWKLYDFGGTVGQGFNRPAVQADLVWAATGLVITSLFTVAFKDFWDLSFPAASPVPAPGPAPAPGGGAGSPAAAAPAGPQADK
jgi:hypothetical protein